MIKTKKIRLIIIAVILFGITGYAAYMCVNYIFYNEYTRYLNSYTFEEGTEFKRLTDSDPKAEGMVLAAENDILKLYTNITTTEVAVYDKRSGEITYSNPVDRDNDPIANGRNMVDLNSQFLLTYYDTSMTQVTMYNHDYSVKKGQYEIESIDNGIRYTYLLGNMGNPTGLVPLFITRERLQQKILDKLTEKEGKAILAYYHESKVKEGFLELMEAAKSNKVGLQKMNKLLEQAGYTQTDFDEDAAMVEWGEGADKTTFTVILDYRLMEDKLIVTVPTGRIIETGSGRLANIDLLSYFGAGGAEEQGYMLVPNGSGSLIYFNNGKKTERYIQYIYGIDEANQSYTVIENTEKARLPVFGIKHEKSAVFAEITSGDALANIAANVSGNNNSYNNVYSSFLLRGAEKVSMFGSDGASADLPALEKDIYDLDITIVYTFLTEEEASYSGMAAHYRNDLIRRNKLAVKEESEAIPFYLDIVGGVKLQQSFLGAPYLGVYPMTTFEEAGSIIDDFLDENINNLRVNYLGWFNGGYYHDAPVKLKVERKLGGKKELEALNTKLAENGGELFGDVAIQKVSFAADHYNWKMESAMYYSGYVVSFGRVNPVTLRQTGGLGYTETNFNLLSPKFLVRHVDQFLNKVNQIDLSGISLRDLGDTLTSDKRRSNVINRQQAKQVVLGALNEFDMLYDALMMNGGNAYSWAFASDLTNIPAGHNPFYIVDEEVPFYQMVIHGCIDYTSGSINLNDGYDKREIILRMIENGSAPHFTFSYEESSAIKYSGLSSLYSTQYKTWFADAVEIYQKTNEALKHVVNSVITEHSVAEGGIRKITYDNDVVIYINPGKTEVGINGILLPAMSYRIEEGLQ